MCVCGNCEHDDPTHLRHIQYRFILVILLSVWRRRRRSLKRRFALVQWNYKHQQLERLRYHASLADTDKGQPALQRQITALEAEIKEMSPRFPVPPPRPQYLLDNRILPLRSKTMEVLSNICRANGIKLSGKKLSLLDRICKWLREHPDQPLAEGVAAKPRGSKRSRSSRPRQAPVRSAIGGERT